LALTLSTARSYIRDDILDDPDSRRYSDAQVERAISLSLSETFEEYEGDRFIEVATGLSTSSTGTVDMSAYDPLQIKAVLLKSGNTYTEIRPARWVDKDLDDLVSGRAISTQFIRRPTPPDADGEYLLQDSSNNQLTSWLAFEDLICVRAALRLCRKDNEIPAGLRADEQRLTKTVMQTTSKKVFTLAPSQRQKPYENLLYYYWDPQAKTITIFQSTFHYYR